jgi:hypothetical protein
MYLEVISKMVTLSLSKGDFLYLSVFDKLRLTLSHPEPVEG